MTERMQYNTALVVGFVLEDDGHEVDWDEIYKAADICNELVPNPYKSKEDREDKKMTDLLKRLGENFPENHQTGEVIYVYELERKEAAAEIKRLKAIADATLLTVEIANSRGVEIERLRALTEWQPIETAPKDGTPYLSCIKGEKEPIVTWWAKVTSCIGETKFGYKTWNGYYANFGACRNPTDWMPLPEPPTRD